MDIPPDAFKMLLNYGLAHKATILTLLALPWYPMLKGIA